MKPIAGSIYVLLIVDIKSVLFAEAARLAGFFATLLQLRSRPETQHVRAGTPLTTKGATAPYMSNIFDGMRQGKLLPCADVGAARVAWNLKRMRTARRVSQEALAFDAEVDRTSISGIENESFNPSIDLLDRLAAVLDVDVGEFLKEPQPGEKLPPPLKRGRRPIK